MKIDIEEFRKKFGKGPSGPHPTFTRDGEPCSSWQFELEVTKTIAEFSAPGSSDYGTALKSAKAFAERNFIGQSLRAIRLVG